MERDPERTKAAFPHKRSHSNSAPGQGPAEAKRHQTEARTGEKGPFLGTTLGQDLAKTGAKLGQHSQRMLLY